jgi:hypothetical protein
VVGADKLGLSALAKKLRLSGDQRIAVLNAPAGHLELLVPGPRDVAVAVAAGARYDAVLLYVHDIAELRRFGAAAVAAARDNGMLWIAFPKGGVATDLPPTPTWVQRDVLGELTSVTGYKAVAFVPVDETWTALRFKRV